MKSELIICLLGTLLLSGCGVAIKVAPKLGKHADEIMKQGKIADDAYKAAQKAHQSRQSAAAVEEAERAIQATQLAKEAQRQAIESAPLAQQRDEITQILKQIERTETEVQFIKLEAQADQVIAATTNKIKSSRDELASASDSDLNEFVRDLLCFHLESVVNKKQWPSDKDYQKFLQDYAIKRFIPAWEIKDKAEDIIEFVEKTAKRRSPAEVQASARLLRECTIKRSGK